MPVELVQFCQKCLQTLPIIPGEAKLLLFEDHCVNPKETNKKAQQRVIANMPKKEIIRITGKNIHLIQKKAEKMENENKELMNK